MKESQESMSMYPWQVESLRFSFINLLPDEATDNFGWANLLPSEPDTVTAKKGMGLRTEQSNWLNGTLSVNRQPGRIDVVYSFHLQDPFATGLDSLLPNAGSFGDVFAACSQFAESFRPLQACRFAFGGVLLLPVENSPEGYDYLKKFLPFISFEEDMSDFFLQINRKKTSPQGIVVNELSKWGCVDVHAINMADPDNQFTPSLHAVRLELDINTPDGTQPLNVDVPALVSEFFERAESISRLGAI